MKAFALLMMLSLMSCMIFAQQTESRDLSDFSAVKSSASIRVILKQGNQAMVDVSTNGELEDVITEVKGGELKIAMAPNKNYRDLEVEVVVYFQNLEKVKASSSSRISGEDVIEGRELTVEASSSARITLETKVDELYLSCASSGRLEVAANSENVDASTSSSGRVSISGEAVSFKGSASSSGRLSAENFNCDIANLTASSSGRIELNVNKEIHAKANSSGRINYGGSPKIVNVDSGSGGKIGRI